jgi:hypothetical protein
MTRKRQLIVGPNATSEAWIDVPEPPKPVGLGDIVLYVMADGVTLRPAIVVSFIFTATETKADLQVFVDGQFDDAKIRGAHANATLQDWKVNVINDEGSVDPKTGEIVFAVNTWHRR